VGQVLRRITRLSAQQQEIVAGAKTGMADLAHGALAPGAGQARLHQDDLPHHQAETTRHGDPGLLPFQHKSGSRLQGLRRAVAIFLKTLCQCLDRAPQEGSNEKGRRHRLALNDSAIRIGQGRPHETQHYLAPRTRKTGLSLGKEYAEELVLPQALKGCQGLAGQEELEALVEEAGCGDILKAVRHVVQRCFRGGGNIEAQLDGKTHGAKHAHRIFPIALLGITNQADQAALEILHAADMIDDGKVPDVVIQGVDGEITPEGILFHIAVDIVAEDHAAVVDIAVILTRLVHRHGPEGGHFDDFGAEEHMSQAKAPSDQATVAKQIANLFRSGVGGHIEILGLASQQEIANTSPNDIGLETGLFEAVEDLERIVGYMLTGDLVLLSRNDQWRSDGSSFPAELNKPPGPANPSISLKDRFAPVCPDSTGPENAHMIPFPALPLPVNCRASARKATIATLSEFDGNQATTMTTQALPSPSLLRRLAAAFYDSLLIIAIWFLATLLVLPLTGGEAIEHYRLLYLLYLLGLTALFFLWFWHRSGQTLGMQAWRIRVLDHRLERPTLAALIVRVVLMLTLLLAALYGLIMLALDDWADWLGFACLSPLLLSMVWCLADRNGRSLHDLASGTRLVLLPKD